MQDRYLNDEKIHIHNNFTELFDLLKKSQLNESENPNDTFTEINMLLLQTDSAMNGMLHGLQVLGSIVAVTSHLEKNDLAHLGHFLSLISNLMEALNALRGDCEYLLYEKDLELKRVGNH